VDEVLCSKTTQNAEQNESKAFGMNHRWQKPSPETSIASQLLGQHYRSNTILLPVEKK
jgi:hypothetical protein